MKHYYPQPMRVACLALLLWGLLLGPLQAQTPNYSRINCGGTAAGSFQADEYATGGEQVVLSSPVAIANATSPDLYQSYRRGEFSYAFPQPAGTYNLKVVLHFAEVQTNISAIGQRVFDVRAEDVQVLSNYDLYRAGGQRRETALTETFQIQVTDGTLNLQFIPHASSSNGPVVAAIEVIAPKPLPAPPANLNQTSIACWGDSFTDNGYGRYPKTLAKLTGLTVENKGYSGQTSTQIKNIMLADADKQTWPSIIWVGRNNSSEPEVVVDDIRAMINRLQEKNNHSYLVVSVCNGEDETAGTYGYGVQLELNRRLKQAFSDHYVDLRKFWVDRYDASLPQDREHYAKDAPPYSLVNQLDYAGNPDRLHPTQYGSDLFATFFFAHLGELMNGQVVTAARAAGTLAAASGNVYPNPFATEATVAFVLPQTSAYTLTLYDATGRLVQQLAAGTAQAGVRYTYPVNSHGLRQGVYSVRLAAGALSKTFQLVLAR